MKRVVEKSFVSPKRKKCDMTEMDWLEKNIQSCKDEIQSLARRNPMEFSEDKYIEMQELIDKWTFACQESLERLLGVVKQRDPSVNMLKLLTILGVEAKDVNWDPEEGEFVKNE
jgi:hypothetical protein